MHTKNLSYLLYFLCFCFLLSFTFQHNFPGWTDENIHLYVANWMGKATLYGNLPSSRPPLVLILLNFFFILGFEGSTVARLAVLFLQVSTSFLIITIFKDILKHNHVKSILAGSLFLLIPVNIFRFHYTGIQLTSLFVLLCWYATHKRSLLLQLLSILGVALSGQHGVVILVVLFFFIAGKENKKHTLTLFTLSLTLPIVIYSLFYFMGGVNLFDSLVFRHLYHVGGKNVSKNTNLFWWFKNWIYIQSFWILCGLFSAKAFFQQKEKCLSLLLPIIFHIAAVFLMKDGLILYMHPAAPFIYIWGTWSFFHLLEQTPSKRWSFLTIIFLFSFLSNFFLTQNYSARDKKDYSFIPYIRAHQMFSLTHAKVAEVLQKKIQLKEGETLFGHGTLVSVVALNLKAKIAGHLADFDPFWNQSGIVKTKDLIRKIEKDRVKYFLSPNWQYLHDPLFKKYLATCYLPPTISPRLPGSGIPRIFLFKRQSLLLDNSFCEQFSN